MMTVLRGIVFPIPDGTWIDAHGISAAFMDFPRLHLAGLPVPSWISIFVVSFGLVPLNLPGNVTSIFIGLLPLGAIALPRVFAQPRQSRS